jgi:hypothetical protein
MAAILTAEDVVQRIAAECAFVDERGGDRAAVWGAIPPRAAPQESAIGEITSPALTKWSVAAFFLHLTYATRKALNGLSCANRKREPERSRLPAALFTM